MIIDIELSKITSAVNIRNISLKGVEILKEKIEDVGFLPEKPLLVSPNGNDEYIVIDGAHRLEALRQLKMAKAPVLVDESLITDVMRMQRARQANNITGVIIPHTWVDDAELVWRLVREGKKHADIGTVLNTSISTIKNYSALKSITPEAWKKVTMFQNIVTNTSDSVVTEKVTTVTFTEGLLRNILDLKSSQQLDLVTRLSKNEINKTQFKKQAEAYKIRNQIYAYVSESLSAIPGNFVSERVKGIDNGAYDKDWQTEGKLQLTKLINAIKDEWEQKSGIQVIHGDFNQEVLNIDDGIVDLILTDIPYNISNQAKVTKQGSQIVNASFDNDDIWDTVNSEDYQSTLDNWVSQWTRITREGGSIISFCDKILVSDFWRLFKEHDLTPKGIIIWQKVNPNPAGLARNNLISSVEFMIWAIKPGSAYTFNKSDSWNCSNIINAPLCAGDERIKDKNGSTLHPTQKPLKVLNPLVEVFSNRGDIIFDGFAGVGSTGEAAISQGRKFIGIEQNKLFCEAMFRRVS